MAMSTLPLRRAWAATTSACMLEAQAASTA